MPSRTPRRNARRSQAAACDPRTRSRAHARSTSTPYVVPALPRAARSAEATPRGGSTVIPSDDGELHGGARRRRGRACARRRRRCRAAGRASSARRQQLARRLDAGELPLHLGRRGARDAFRRPSRGGSPDRRCRGALDPVLLEEAHERGGQLGRIVAVGVASGRPRPPRRSRPAAPRAGGHRPRPARPASRPAGGRPVLRLRIDAVDQVVTDVVEQRGQVLRARRCRPSRPAGWRRCRRRP